MLAAKQDVMDSVTKGSCEEHLTKRFVLCLAFCVPFTVLIKVSSFDRELVLFLFLSCAESLTENNHCIFFKWLVLLSWYL